MVCVKVHELTSRYAPGPVRRKLQSCRQFVAGRTLISHAGSFWLVIWVLLVVVAIWFRKDQMVVTVSSRLGLTKRCSSKLSGALVHLLGLFSVIFFDEFSDSVI